jgi:hypothetical protein
MQTFTYRLQKARETKGAVLYDEIDANGKKLDGFTGKVGNQYIRKSSFPNKIPDTLKVTVEYE